jgi:hypothetical protein
MTLQELQDTIGQWSEVTFDDAGPLPKVHHLKREVDELLAEPYARFEYADCLILLVDAARKAGISADTLIETAFEKMEINKRRVWVMDAHGISHHLVTAESQAA